MALPFKSIEREHMEFILGVFDMPGDRVIPAAERPFVRSAYNYDMELASDESGLFCADATRTQQGFADEVDINSIVRRFGLTGEMPNDLRMPLSVDISDAVYDYHSAMNIVKDADAEFMRLPAATRARFNNQPGLLIAFLEDDKNRPEAEELGLVGRSPAAPAPLEVFVKGGTLDQAQGEKSRPGASGKVNMARPDHPGEQRDDF